MSDLQAQNWNAQTHLSLTLVMRSLLRIAEPEDNMQLSRRFPEIQIPFERAPWHSTFLSMNIATARVTRDTKARSSAFSFRFTGHSSKLCR